jgi:alkanesulfonate monooxygenase SsuD/methylene tetrahydromethanopterin reductase-like flavin-dependent oxidoreductase (luciferase family)
MKLYSFTEQSYPDAWFKDAESLRVSLPSRHCDPEVASRLYNRYLDEWMLADELGLNIIVNEHHATATCMSASVHLTLAILARQTKRARLLGLGTPIANRNDPLRVAEEMSIIDVISRGRLEMGFIKGVPYEIVPSNARPVGVMDRFWEAHDLILKAMTTHDGPFSWEGEYFQYRSVNVWPRPYQQPHPPVWSTSSSPGSSRALGQRGHVIATVMTGYRAKTVFDDYRKGWKEAGRPQPTPLDRFGYMGFVAVGHSEAEGLRRAGQVKSYLETNTRVAEPYKNPPGFMAAADAAKLFQRVGWRGASHQMATKDGKPLGSAAQASVADTIAGGLMFAGTPDQVFDQVVDFYRAVGGFGHFLMMTQAGAMDHNDTVDSMTLFAREVMPRLEEFHAAAQLAA